MSSHHGHGGPHSGLSLALMRECSMRCSARKVVLCVALIIGLRLLWLSLFSTSNRSAGQQSADAADNHGMLMGLFGSKSSMHFKSSASGTGLEPRDDGKFYLDGKPLRILSGSFHYFRVRPEQWQDRLERMKAAGLNVVMTYIPWNMHERHRGKYDFAPDGYDLVRFIKLVQQMEMLLIVRPGPYICAEWELGGLPSWLLHDPNMVTRTSKNASYLNHLRRYFDQLLPLLARFMHQRGGPIVAVQVENEFGSYSTSPDHTYLRFIVNLIRSSNINELLFTSDGAYRLAQGALPGMFTSVNFNKNASTRLELLRKFQPRKPLMVTEFWPGWFDHWGDDKHHTMAVDVFNGLVDTILSYNASINFYMFVGSTNFGFWNGANQVSGTVLPTVTSYDYDTLISECGDVHPQKFAALRTLLNKHGLVNAASLPPIPKNHPKRSYGNVKVEEAVSFESLYKLAENPLTLRDPIFMEFLSLNNNGGQGYGYIVYHAVVHDHITTLSVTGQLHDWAQVLVNGQVVKTLDNREGLEVNEEFHSGTQETENSVDILVENMGRVNYETLDNQRKGFQGQVSGDTQKIRNWEHIPLEFDAVLINALQHSKDWKPVIAGEDDVPRLYRAWFTIADEPLDTFLDMSDWEKGVAIINGFVLGRYWKIGPQRTLYVPWPLLKKGKNEIIVFELQKAARQFTFINKPIL